ncbi:hypothetical protein LZC95_47190 [Pendulispora brunnea]|uniref:DUF2330 domain-containing protein n=1 Tax=Pendulispora brunnea TaxID=2905690 RepID=A0ABZ2KA95_9BACT
MTLAMQLGVRALWLTLVLLCFVIVPRSAGAVGLVLPGDANQVTQVRIAVAPSAARTVRWYSLSTAHAEPLVWIIPTGKNAVVSAVSHAWLEALDEASAVQVIPSCGPSSVETHRSVQVGPSPFPPELDTATSLEELDTKLGAPDLPAGVRNDLARRLATQNLVVVRTKGPHTPVIRVVDAEAGMPVPLSLLRSERNVEVTAFVVSEQPSMLGTRIDWPPSIHWFGERSDYLLKRDVALSGAAPGAFVVESSPSIVPSVTAAYLDLAARYGDRADDLELARAQRAPDSLRITRLAGRIPAQGASPDLRVSALSSPAPDQVLTAHASCSSGGGRGGGSSAPPSRNDSYESAGCSGSSSSSRGSSSSSSESCSSDTTDSSSSREEDGEGCSSDTTDSDGSDHDDDSDDSCDKDDDGSSSDKEEDQCSTSGAKRRFKGRSPLSRGVLVLALIVLPLRRLGRRKPA